MAIDRRLKLAALFFATGGLFSLFGLIHSPLDSNAVFLPFSLPGMEPSWVLDPSLRSKVYQFAIAYLLTAGVLLPGTH